VEPELPITMVAGDGSTSDAPAAPLARRTVYAVIALALFMASVDQTIVATALPVLQLDLHTRLDWGGWTITAYTLGQLLTMPIAGKACEQFGRRRIFLGSVMVFSVASLACGLSTNIYELIGLRVLQSTGGGAFLPAATGIVTDMFGEDRDRALAFFTSIFPIGGIVGPVLGGVFTDYWSWRGIFLINVPIGVVLVAIGLRVIPSPRVKRNEQFDLLGVGQLASCLIAGMLGMTYLGRPDRSVMSVGFIVAVAWSMLSGAAFVRHSRRDVAPVIPYRLLAGRGFGAMNVINIVFGAAAAGFSALVPIYAQDQLGISPLSSSVMLIARSAAMVLASVVAVRLLRRTGVRRPMLFGYLVIAGGLLLMRVDGFGLTTYTWIAIGAALTGLGIGASAPSSNNAALQLEPANAAAIAGIRGMIRQVGGITAVSVSTAVAARSGDPGQALGWLFSVFAVVLLLALPLVRRVPEHRGSW
jgi:EmrB/QacA subfamily drug resistance transporter